MFFIILLTFICFVLQINLSHYDYLTLKEYILLLLFIKATTTEEKIECIVMQKYFQSFFPQACRSIYPQTEYNYNSDNVSVAIERQFGEENDKTNQKVWWLP